MTKAEKIEFVTN
jgi:hypothetical protein